MMSPSKIRAELLGQHAEIRQHLVATRNAADRLKAGEPADDELRAALVRLGAAVRLHNAREEELLEDLIRTVDAWGDVRAEVLAAEHKKEHHQMFVTLVKAGASTDPAQAIALAEELVSAMLEHMAVEEKVLLAEDVLRDDVIAREYFGG